MSWASRAGRQFRRRPHRKLYRGHGLCRAQDFDFAGECECKSLRRSPYSAAILNSSIPGSLLLKYTDAAAGRAANPVFRELPAVRRGVGRDRQEHHLLDLPVHCWLRCGPRIKPGSVPPGFLSNCCPILILGQRRPVDLGVLRRRGAHEHEPVPGARRDRQVIDSRPAWHLYFASATRLSMESFVFSWCCCGAAGRRSCDMWMTRCGISECECKRSRRCPYFSAAILNHSNHGLLLKCSDAAAGSAEQPGRDTSTTLTCCRSASR